MFKGAAAKRSPQALGAKMKSSQQAVCVPIIIGQPQLSPRLIWRANQQTHDTSSKKGKSAKKGAGIQSFTADFDMLLGTTGFGRTRQNQNFTQAIQALLAIWSDKDKFDVLYSTQTSVVSAGAVTIAVPGGGVLIQIMSVTVSEAYSQTFNDYGSPGAVTYAGTWERPLWNSVFHYYDHDQVTPHNGSDRPGYTAVASVALSTTVPFDASLNGKTVNIHFAYVAAAQNLPLTKVNQTFERQLGESHATGQPLVYDDISGVAVPNCDMGAANMAPNFKYQGLSWGLSPGDGDANPADIVQLMVMSPHALNGSAFLQQAGGPVTLLGSLTGMRDYCDAWGIWLSMYLDSQRNGMDILNDLFDIANCAPFWSEGVLKVVPRAEVSAAGNGAIFTAPTSAGPVWTLSPNDFVCAEGAAPVRIERSDENADGDTIAKNVLPVEYTDRNNDFVLNSVDVQEGQSLSEFGPRRADTKSYPWIHKTDVARIVGSALIKRMATLGKMVISYKLPPNFLQMECYDLSTLTDAITQLAGFAVRPISVTVNGDNSIDVEAEPFHYGANTPYGDTTAQAASPGTVYTNLDPGSVNAPYIFEPVPRLYGGAGNGQLWIAIAGSSANYGGCGVHISADGGTTYHPLGRLVGRSVMGTHSSVYAAGTDPDTTHDLTVDLSAALGTLDSFSAAEADAFLSLALLSYDGGVPPGGSVIPYELLAYTQALFTSAHHYTLKATGAGNEIRRAVYSAPLPGGVGAFHGFTAPLDFVYLKGPLFKIEMDPSWIGKTLKFKFTAFNVFGTNEESEATVAVYTFTPTGVAQSVAAQPYSITPANPLSQGALSYIINMAQCSANFASGATNYNARTFAKADPGVGLTQQYWVTVYDPNYLGDTGTGTTLTAFADTNQTRWNTAGYVRIGTIVLTHNGSTSGGGGGSSSTAGLSQPVINEAPDGVRTVFTLDRVVNVLILSMEGQLIDPSDITFVPGTATFTLDFAPPTGAHFRAIGGG